MYVCTYGRTHACMHGCMHGWTDCMYAWMDAWMYVCMYVGMRTAHHLPLSLWRRRSVSSFKLSQAHELHMIFLSKPPIISN